MDNLEYSTAALEAKALFYNKKAVLYVEGIDDPLFWYEFTSKLSLDLHIEEIGGGENLEKIIDKIIEDDARIYVALDRDYLDFYDEEVKQRYIHDRVLLTYGHSIENTLYNSKILNEVIKSYVRVTDFDKIQEIEECFQMFEQDVKNLLIFDILSNKFNSSVKILGDSCMRHLKSAKSLNLCPNKILSYIQDLPINYANELKIDIENKIDNSDKTISQIIKGHYLTSFVINLIKSYIKRFRNKEITFSNDNLYSSIIDKIFFIEDLDEYKHYLNECSKINYA
ncbi:DUF4435 domain-containing protein [Epilithonimonas xixisoli]|uniref:Uncharacterized protein DUF4435 n=1 Tax=Epilithonimonas xixisoli TaxID=1476462 RepID=A0A4R8IIB7_9FLAO|nr:DUF4435 domain-containing protein [Epilithonimonas xixisoli]TDX86653.1 uncharacterized protein DUF4435 [Epilithonimonas xixisoli]